MTLFMSMKFEILFETIFKNSKSNIKIMFKSNQT